MRLTAALVIRLGRTGLVAVVVAIASVCSVLLALLTMLVTEGTIDGTAALSAFIISSIVSGTCSYWVAGAVVELIQIRGELERITRVDDLTAVANRRHFTEVALAAVADGGPVAVAIIDIDRFKQINDVYGHPVGDTVLRSVAEVISASVRPGDLVARIGGDEFAVLLPNATAELAEFVRRRIEENVSTSFAVDGHAVRPSVSVGVASKLEDEHMSLDQLLAAADFTMYQHKAS